MKLDHVGSYHTGIYGGSAAEIPAYSSIKQRLYVTNSAEHSIMILDISNPANITKVTDIPLAAWGSPNSVAVYGNYVAVAVEATTKTNPGNVIVFDLNGNFLKSIPVGALPDMLTFTHDGKKILVCNEGEPNNSYTIDPEGSVSIIDLTNGLNNATVATATFTQFNGSEGYLRSLGIRIFGPNASAAQDFEPEYLTITPDNVYAYVVLQENNAMATIHIPTATVISVKPLGYKDHMLPGNGLDASDRDNIINIANWPVKGMYQPDGITSYTVNGKFYLVTANEGDARDYDGYAEESRVNGLNLDPVAFPDAAYLKNNANLGRLTVTKANGDNNGDGLYEELYVFGARSFTIWDDQLNVVFDSGDQFEQIIKSMYPAYFNVSNADKNFDSRSDNKGPEPEDVKVVNIRGEYYAFVLLERQGGIMVFNISDPHNPKFVTWENNRDYNAPFPSNPTPAQLLAIGDLGPEGIVHIPAAVSPNGYDMFAVTNEVSGSVSLFKVVLTPVVNLENKSTCKRVAVSLGTDGGDNTVLWGSGDYTYTWSPSSGLDLTNPANPVWLSPVFSKNFNLTVKDNVTGYIAQGSIYVTVNEGPSFSSPNLYSHPKNMPLDLNDLLTNVTGTNPITYAWADDNGIINDPTYVIPPVGLKKYYIQATDGDGCESMEKRIMVYVNPKSDMPPTKNYADNVPDVGVNGNLVVYSYPNPVVNEFSLDIELFEKSDIVVKIMDITGKVLSESIHTGDSIKSQINVEHLSTGVYLMSIETENDFAIRKIIKQ
jgi:hypothetical protein